MKIDRYAQSDISLCLLLVSHESSEYKHSHGLHSAIRAPVVTPQSMEAIFVASPTPDVLLISPNAMVAHSSTCDP